MVVVGLAVVAVILVPPGLPAWIDVAALMAFVVGLALYFRLGTPRARALDLEPPVRGRWMAVNSPASRVPSHHVHAWGQTYAIDLVFDAAGQDRPGLTWWPLARSPGAFLAFGEPVRSPVDGEVVRAVSFLRDHLSRTSPLGVLYLLLESVRELLGPWAIVGNHITIRSDAGPYVLLAHLKRRSLQVKPGDRVAAGDVIAECGNSGNSSEPHVHLQVMDRKSPWFAAGLPFEFGGSPPPANGTHLTV